MSEAERKRPGLQGNTCVPRPVRGKRRRCGAKGWEREERWVSGSSDNFRRLSSKRNHRTLLHRGQRQGRVGTFFIKVSLGKRRRVSISFLSIYARHTSLYRHTRNTSMIFPSASIEPRSIDRSVEHGKIVGSRLCRKGNGMVERATAAAAFLSSERELRFREQQVLTVPLCGARYGWRDIEGRTEEQSCNERRSTPQNSRLRII